ncbi:hypothetical protein T484DRAFT_3634450 [Baffinella frigidus]|nr:hypothetical protein T484DRAFT_3634450 [Cryptophyta sp. CCMP2293]
MSDTAREASDLADNRMVLARLRALQEQPDTDTDEGSGPEDSPPKDSTIMTDTAATLIVKCPMPPRTKTLRAPPVNDDHSTIGYSMVEKPLAPDSPAKTVNDTKPEPKQVLPAVMEWGLAPRDAKMDRDIAAILKKVHAETAAAIATDAAPDSPAKTVKADDTFKAPTPRTSSSKSEAKRVADGDDDSRMCKKPCSAISPASSSEKSTASDPRTDQRILTARMEVELALEEPAPSLEEPAPSLDEPMPSLDEAMPPLDEPMPPLDEPAPPVNKSPKVLACITPLRAFQGKIHEVESGSKFLNLLDRDILGIENLAKDPIYNQDKLAEVYAEIRRHAKKIYTMTNMLLDHTVQEILDAAKKMTPVEEMNLEMHEKRVEWCEHVSQLATNLMKALDLERPKD